MSKDKLISKFDSRQAQGEKAENGKEAQMDDVGEERSNLAAKRSAIHAAIVEESLRDMVMDAHEGLNGEPSRKQSQVAKDVVLAYTPGVYGKEAQSKHTATMANTRGNWRDKLSDRELHPSCFICTEPHWTRHCPQRPKSSMQGGKPCCFICGELHWARECPQRPFYTSYRGKEGTSPAKEDTMEVTEHYLATSSVDEEPNSQAREDKPQEEVAKPQGSMDTEVLANLPHDDGNNSEDVAEARAMQEIAPNVQPIDDGVTCMMPLPESSKGGSETSLVMQVMEEGSKEEHPSSPK